jgi:hypothetical protein
LKQKKLDELIGQQLLDQEAAGRGISVEALLAKEAPAPEITDAQVEKFYQQNKHRMVDRPEAELKQKTREILKKYRLLYEKQKYIESLRTGAKISTFLASPQPADEWRALKNDVESLKETQTSIQKDLQEIKSLLR